MTRRTSILSVLCFFLGLHSFAFAGNLTIGPGVMIGNNDIQYSSVLFDRLAVNSSGNLTIGATEKAPGAATAALAGLGAGNVNNGTHSYKITFVTAGGETDAGAVSGTVTTVAGDGQVSLSAIPTGSVYVTSRKVYRTAAGNAVTGPWLLLATISDNTTTTYADNTADASLTTAIPTANTAIDTRWTFKNSGVFDTANTAPSLTFTDTTASAKSLTIAVDANLAQLRESAGAAGSLLELDLANNTVRLPTLIGGTGTASTLTLQSTTGVGATDAIVFLVGNNGATEAARFLSGGRFQVGEAGILASVGNPLYLGSNGGINMQLDTSQTLKWLNDNTGDIGASGAARPRTGYFGTSVVTPLLHGGTNGTLDIGSSTVGTKRLFLDFTNTATIGAVTINKASFRANIALGATSVVVTNSYVTAASKVLCVAAQNDATGRVTATVPGAGTVTIHSIAPTADMAVDCLVVNAD